MALPPDVQWAGSTRPGREDALPPRLVDDLPARQLGDREAPAQVGRGRRAGAPAGNYPALFLAGGAFMLLGALAVRPIRGVR